MYSGGATARGDEVNACEPIRFVRPHPSPLPQEREREGRVQLLHDLARVRQRLERADLCISQKDDRRAPSPGGEGWGEGGPHFISTSRA